MTKTQYQHIFIGTMMHREKIS